MPPISEDEAWKRGLNKWNFWRDAAPYAAGFTYFGGLGISSGGAVAESISAEIIGAEMLGAEASAGLELSQIPLMELSNVPLESLNVEQIMMRQFTDRFLIPEVLPEAPNIDVIVDVASASDAISVHSAGDIISSTDMVETQYTSTPEQMGARPKVTNRATQMKPEEVLQFDIEDDPQVDLADRIVSKKTTTNDRGHDLMWERARSTTKTRSGKPYEYIEMQDVSEIFDPNDTNFQRGDQPSVSAFDNPAFEDTVTLDEYMNEPFNPEMDELLEIHPQSPAVSGDSVLFDNDNFVVKMGERYGPEGFEVTFKTNEVRWIDGVPQVNIDGEWETIRVPKSVTDIIERYFPDILPKPKPTPRPQPRPRPTPKPIPPTPKHKPKKTKTRGKLPRKCVRRDRRGRCIKYV
ncbi:L2 protein [Papillomaviridae sp. Haddock_c145]|nr:L2 protein [Papillomaviridae sp. Haddock_c145]